MSNFLAKAYPVIGQGLSLIYSPGAQAAVGYCFWVQKVWHPISTFLACLCMYCQKQFKTKNLIKMANFYSKLKFVYPKNVVNKAHL